MYASAQSVVCAQPLPADVSLADCGITDSESSPRLQVARRRRRLQQVDPTGASVTAGERSSQRRASFAETSHIGMHGVFSCAKLPPAETGLEPSTRLRMRPREQIRDSCIAC